MKKRHNAIIIADFRDKVKAFVIGAVVMGLSGVTVQTGY